MPLFRPRPRRRAASVKPAPGVLHGARQSEEGSLATSLLCLEQWGDLTRGLTPARLVRILEAADAGQIMEQHALFADMEDRCDHLSAEMGKRRRALLTLDWNIIPASDDAKAKDAAEKVREWFDMLPDFEDVLLDMADGIGHGFSALELQWEFSEGIHLPSELTFRPQSWFTCPQNDRNCLHLRDGTLEGAPLWPLGWIVHKHRSKSGWLPRAGLFRVLAWTYLIRAYALNSEMAFTQIHGLPMRVGKYPPGSSKDDKHALLNALRTLGQDAAGIIPQGMDIVFETVNPATQDIPGLLVERCERGMSKAILGGTLTSQADGKTSTNALGMVHNEIRHDLLVADAAQLASTLTAQLVAPLCALNLGITDRKLLPYFRFDTQQAEDLELYANAIPSLAPYLPISSRGIMERLKLPVAADDNDRIRATHVSTPEDQGQEDASTRTAHAKAGPMARPPQDAAQGALDGMQASAALALAGEALLAPLIAELDAGLSPEDMQARLGELYPQMDETQLAEIMARALFVSEVWGRVQA
ncbi:DUF935 domain-containing protein [Desulfovibrio sp. 1188_IL3213]|uniref:DUF935 domain-containing protein n=2 Tax=unclassified Desulfovibrio TaxID=2593640 RepID=UPI0025D17A82|nr:DUF935 domain-containing protein [uncultured Desulfovibrio sp.]